MIWDRRYIGRVGAQHKQLYVCTPQGQTYIKDVTQAAALMQQSVHETIHVLYDDTMEHYEYFDKEVGERGTTEESRQSREREEQEQCGNRMERDKGGLTEEKGETPRSAMRGEETEPTKKRTRTVGTGETRGEQILEMLMGTMNISGISYGYRGKYMKTEEELLKIRPGDKIRDVTEMMKTQGVSLMTLTDTHLSQEGMGEISKFLQQEGLGGGGIAAKREMTEGMEYSARRRAGIYFVWDPTKLAVEGIEEVYASRVARASIQVLDSGKELEIYGVYMPVKNNKAERMEEIWETIMQDITNRGTRNSL
eukprot:3118977-Pleurochrysis_carterae.AAC.1